MESKYHAFVIRKKENLYRSKWLHLAKSGHFISIRHFIGGIVPTIAVGICKNGDTDVSEGILSKNDEIYD